MNAKNQKSKFNLKRQSAVVFASSFILCGTTTCFAQDLKGVLSDQDSILPPEVMPVAADQLATSTPNLSTNDATSAGSAGPASSLAGVQTAQQARQAAFNSLMGNQQWNPQMNEALQAQATAKAQAQTVAAGAQGTTQPAQTDIAQSQTLTGGVKYQQNYQNTTRSGATNATSGVLGMASGVLYPGQLLYPNSMMGIAALGIGATGLGIRNGFRW